MGRWVLGKAKPVQNKKLFKVFLIVAWLFPPIGLIAPMGVNYLNDQKNKSKWIGALIGFILGVIDFVFIVLSFDVFHLPILAVAFFIWHFGGALIFGIVYPIQNESDSEDNL